MSRKEKQWMLMRFSRALTSPPAPFNGLLKLHSLWTLFTVNMHYNYLICIGVWPHRHLDEAREKVTWVLFPIPCENVAEVVLIPVAINMKHNLKAVGGSCDWVPQSMFHIGKFKLLGYYFNSKWLEETIKLRILLLLLLHFDKSYKRRTLQDYANCSGKSESATIKLELIQESFRNSFHLNRTVKHKCQFAIPCWTPTGSETHLFGQGQGIIKGSWSRNELINAMAINRQGLQQEPALVLQAWRERRYQSVLFCFE